MVEIQAKVVDVDEGFAWVVSERGQLCAYCNPETGCKSLAISRLFCSKNPAFQVRDPIGVQINDTVYIGIADNTLLQHAILGYGIPVFALVVGAIVGLYLGQESLSILGGGAGLLISIGWLRKRKWTVARLPVVIRQARGGC